MLKCWQLFGNCIALAKQVLNKVDEKQYHSVVSKEK